MSWQSLPFSLMPTLKLTDQPAHPQSLSVPLVVCSLARIHVGTYIFCAHKAKPLSPGHPRLRRLVSVSAGCKPHMTGFLMTWLVQHILSNNDPAKVVEFVVLSYEPGHEKMCLMSYVNNKVADQPAHPRSLISTFIVRCLDTCSIISLDSIAKIWRL